MRLHPTHGECTGPYLCQQRHWYGKLAIFVLFIIFYFFVLLRPQLSKCSCYFRNWPRWACGFTKYSSLVQSFYVVLILQSSRYTNLKRASQSTSPLLIRPALRNRWVIVFFLSGMIEDHSLIRPSFHDISKTS